jgi:hypothetical protein
MGTSNGCLAPAMRFREKLIAALERVPATPPREKYIGEKITNTRIHGFVLRVYGS